MSKLAENKSLVPEERIASKILFLRGEKIILDFHLADLYGTETRALKQAVKRNIERFPSDFMFELSVSEIDNLVSHFVIPSKSYLGGAVPYAFTETGVAMLSSVLKSKQAVDINIAIMRTFVMLRKMLYNYQELLSWQNEIEQKLGEHNNQILIIFQYLKQFERAKQQESEHQNRPRIGFKSQK
ncbi:MAG: ORF6N domain-containing protein [Bacteroidota bacterium]|nr:ORF6N domain-containing protein [Bacteroidota bacterium]